MAVPCSLSSSPLNCFRQSDTSAKGWNVVQDKILSHDEDMIKYYVDDIDTLLVFVRGCDTARQTLG